MFVEQVVSLLCVSEAEGGCSCQIILISSHLRVTLGEDNYTSTIAKESRGRRRKTTTTSYLKWMAVREMRCYKVMLFLSLVHNNTDKVYGNVSEASKLYDTMAG